MTPALWAGTSWKMHKTPAEALAFAGALRAADPDPHIQRSVVPPFTAAREVKARLRGTSVKVGAQTMHWADAAAWTGEVSPLMLADCGLDLVERDHSECHAQLGEINETVGLKVEAAVRHGLVPLVCLGETRTDRDGGRADEVLERQTRAALACVPDHQVPVLLAYEPVRAIGESSTPATADHADARQAAIKRVARDALGRDVPCLYGGSVDPGNCAELALQPHVGSLFIGSSAWEPSSHLDILARVSAALSHERTPA